MANDRLAIENAIAHAATLAGAAEGRHTLKAADVKKRLAVIVAVLQGQPPIADPASIEASGELLAVARRILDK